MWIFFSIIIMYFFWRWHLVISNFKKQYKCTCILNSINNCLNLTLTVFPSLKLQFIIFLGRFLIRKNSLFTKNISDLRLIDRYVSQWTSLHPNRSVCLTLCSSVAPARYDQFIILFLVTLQPWYRHSVTPWAWTAGPCWLRDGVWVAQPHFVSSRLDRPLPCKWRPRKCINSS